jgi:hypothetical protein
MSVPASNDRVLRFGVEPQTDALRPDPRFKEMLQRVGLPA